MRLLKTGVCFLILAAAAFAQSDRGTITGTISDPAGAVVQSARIEVKNMDTGTVFQGGTSSTGNYVIAVPVGRYELDVTVTGFKKYVRQNLQVAVATDTRQDVTLEVGAATESVTVTGEAPLLKTESGELSHNVSASDANNLPVLMLTGSQSLFSNGFGNIRDPLAVSQLLPGVTYATDAGISVNGLPASTQALRIEGQDATNGTWRQNTQISQSGMDAIQEVSIQTSNFAAEYGQAGGGYFNYTMKSGTNQLHGSAYLQMVNDALNAGLPFTDAGLTDSRKAGQLNRPAERKFDYGGTIGGPIRIPKVYNGQNRSFFFFNFERYQETKGFPFLYTVPTDAYRKGDFSSTPLFPVGFPGPPLTDALGRIMLVDQVYDPKTTRTLPTGEVVRDPFPGGVIPPGQLDPVALAIQNYIPKANVPGLALNNYVGPNYTDYQHTTNWSVKLDHQISPTIKLSGFYNRTLTYNPNSNGLPGPINQPAVTNNSSNTTRINYDQSISPTLLLHLGIGMLYTYIPSGAQHFDQTTLGLHGYYNSTYFPNFTGLNDFFNGGVNLSPGGFGGGGAIGPNGFFQNLWDEKPTANANLTWVKGNHTYKFGGELMIEGFPDISDYRTNGIFGASATSTANPDENRVGAAFPFTTGFGYASFLLGQVDNLNINPPQQSKLGNHSLGFYAQDSWKVTRKLTLDYGLRYDYVTYLREQYGRMPSGSFNTINPTLGRNGATLFEGYGSGRCNCEFSHNYPWAFQPRISFAYQVFPKTVIRGGFGIQYSAAPNNAFLSYNDTVFYQFNGPGYGIPFLNNLTSGNPFAPGNPQGLAPLVYPNFDEGIFPTKTGLGYVPQSPFITMDRSSRPPRIWTWSFGVQRELMRDLVFEATYVGNRGVWFTAPELDALSYNALQPSDLTRWGLNINNPADQQLLLTPISSPAVISRFPWLANPNSVYNGFPSSQPLNQAIRPVPQWDGVPPFLGPPLGSTWYDALQIKGTKRYSHGLSMQGSFSWSKNEVLGTSAETQYFTPGTPLINDVYNVGQNKQLAQLGRPLAIVISGTYVTPKMRGDSSFAKAASQVLRDWQLGALLRYQSGALIQTPPSNNGLTDQLARAGDIAHFNNPAGWGGGFTFYNVVPGKNPFLIDPNQKGFDPTKQLALNPAAWVDAAPGQWGASAPFYNNYRWQRQPMENVSFARNFRMGKEGRYTFQVRAEFQNIFNRLFYSMPSVTGGFFPVTPATPAQNMNAFPNGQTGALSAGYGFVNFLNGAGSQPRSGQIIARFTF
ncbi:MAG TPA: TonB-dependent receptor [Bryobacteraceae bacterium]|nr:TonB-dependent receptor [Bryobacteraceae bacterium]